jgi:hypothetical protein
MNYLVRIMIYIDGQYHTPQEILDKINDQGDGQLILSQAH